MQLMVIGVSASGKTTLGIALADALKIAFLDCDDLHPPHNVDKMRAGQPLSDADREPWLAAICTHLVGNRASHSPCVYACSALKRAYRARFRTADPDLIIVYLNAGRELLQVRLSHRSGHFMPASLLESQLATLEEPEATEPVVRIDASLPLEAQISTVLDKVGRVN